MSDQANRGSSHYFKQMNLSLKNINKTNEKLDTLIELLTELVKKQK